MTESAREAIELALAICESVPVLEGTDKDKVEELLRAVIEVQSSVR